MKGGTVDIETYVMNFEKQSLCIGISVLASIRSFLRGPGRFPFPIIRPRFGVSETVPKSRFPEQQIEVGTTVYFDVIWDPHLDVENGHYFDVGLAD
jgi:hypothetical protein